jgi:flagellar export protein FliJ
MKFKFQLDPVLKLKEREVDRIRREMSPFVSNLNNIQRKIDLFTKNLDEFNTQKISFIDNAQKSTDFSFIAGHYQEIIRSSRKKYLEMENKLKPYKEKLSQALKRKRAIELIKEKKEKQFKKDIAKLEQKQMDELNSCLQGGRYGIRSKLNGSH